MKTETKASGACPTFFRAACRTASHGGGSGYEEPGYTLVGGVASLLDDDLDAKLEALDGFLMSDDDDAVLGWFDRELPRCMALVPRRRRLSFLRGVHRFVFDEENDVTAY